MKLGIPLVLAVLLATPSLASAQRAEGGTRTKAAADAQRAAAADPAKKPPARKGAKAKEQGTSGVSPQARAIARQTKSVYIYAQESCARDPQRCDQTLLVDAESRFLDTCGACNTAERCEAERDAVKSGTARASQDPCKP
jgi:hypothetical protein